MESFFLGSVLLYAGHKAPDGFANCDGSVYSVNGNQALYSVLGNKFGGDNNVMTFALPDLRSKAPEGMMYIICTAGLYPVTS